jgi:hypothetical protein
LSCDFPAQLNGVSPARKTSVRRVFGRVSFV